MAQGRCVEEGMSDTPRTDAIWSKPGREDRTAEFSDLARQLERELALLAASWKKAEDRVAELDGTVKAMVEWLEADEPSVFRRGLWDAIRAAQPKTSR
jgi:hypothetical protein